MKRTIPARGVLALLASLVVAGSCHAGGRVIAIADEWLLSDNAFTSDPGQATTLALNCAEYLVGSSGSVLVYSTSFSLTGTSLATVMQNAGYGWTVTTAVPFTLETLSQFDAVCLAGQTSGSAASPALIAQYVAEGGSVLVCSGTGEFGSGPSEAAAWNPVLAPFGLVLSGEWFPVPSTITVPTVPSTNPVAAGVTSVFWGYGHVIAELLPADPATDIILADFGAYALPASGVIGTFGGLCAARCPGDLDGSGTVDGADLGLLLGAWATAGPLGDLNCDGVVDGADLGMLLAAWGAC